MFSPEMPVPLIEADTQEFWEACRDRRLVVQQCAGCDSFRFGPSPICYSCRSFDYRLVESKGLGEVFSWIVTHHSVHPATQESLPYNSVVVRLHDCGGAMLISNLLGVDNDQIYAGQQVRVEWDEVSDEVTLPRFRPI